MITFVIRRLIIAIIVVIIVSLIVFFMMRLLPGDPLLLFLTQQQYEIYTEEQIDLIRHEAGLDKALIVQYFDWLSGIFQGDFGESLFHGKEVTELISQRLPVTVYLGAIALVLGTSIGMVAGVLSAIRRGKLTDLFMTLLANTGITIPVFWLGIILIYIFGLQLHWLPIQGYTSPFDDLWLSIRQAIMPIICLSIFTIGGVARQTRSSVLEVVRQDYIRTAWSKGLAEHRVILKHVLKNSLIPIVTLSGIQVGHILGGSVLVESVFNVVGMGRLAVEAIQGLDYTVIQAIILISAVMIVTANFIVDVSYGWLDPRIRYT